MEGKKDFIAFVKHACENSPRREEFVKQVVEKGMDEEMLRSLLHSWGYEDVSLEDCAIVLRLAKAQGDATKALEPLY